MTSDFEFLEGRLRRQLPDLADAYGAPPVPQAMQQPSSELFDDDLASQESVLASTEDVSVVQLESRRQVERPRTSRLAIVAAVAGVLAVVGVLATAIGGRDTVTTADPAARPAETSVEAELETEAVAETAPTLEIAVDSTTSDPITATNTIGTASTTGTSLTQASDQALPTAPASTTASTTASTSAATTAASSIATTASTATSVSDRGCVGNRVWEDLDGDGIQDLGEAGMIGVTVGLWNQAGSRVDEAVLMNGYFSLCGPAGEYRIAVEIPENYKVTAADQGPSDHKDSDADPTGSIKVTVDAGKNRSRFDIGLTPIDDEAALPVPVTTPIPRPVRVTAPVTNPVPVTTPTTTPVPGQSELAWGFWVETRNAYAPAADPGVEPIFNNYSFAHVKAQSLHSVNGDTTDQAYVVNVLRAAEQTNTVLDLQLGSASEYGWNFKTGRGNFSLDRWLDGVSRFGSSDRSSRASSGATIAGDPVASAAIQRAIDKGTIRYIFLIDEPNHKRWSPQWNGKSGSAATGSSNHVTNKMLDEMAAHVKELWGDHTKTIVRTAPTNLIVGARGGMYRFEHMTHAYLTISSTKWMAGGRKGPDKGLEWFLTQKNNHTDGVTNFSAFKATNLEMSLMVQAGFKSSGNPWTGESGFASQWWQGSIQYPYKGQTSYVKTAPGEMDYWIKSMLSKRHPETGVLDPAGVRWIDDFSIFRADRFPTDAGRLPFSQYPHYRTFLDQLGADLDAGRLDPIIGLPVGWQGN